MADPTLDILCVGNAIVDVLAPVDEGFIAAHGLEKGSMRLIDAAEAGRLYAALPPGREVGGGSAANTAAGVAAFGARAGFVGRVADDALGATFTRDIRAAGVTYATPPGGAEPPTARSMIAVTPDAQRTMSTFLGASLSLDAADLPEALVASAAILYLEGYLWDPERPRAAMQGAIGIARAAGRRVALSLSDAFLLARHGDDFRALLHDGALDLMFANEAEAVALTGTASFDDAARALAGAAAIVVVTRGADGAVVLADDTRYAVPAALVPAVIDTTGAGDLFASGFLAALTRALPLPECARWGAVAAGEVISHYGARPEANLRALLG